MTKENCEGHAADSRDTSAAPETLTRWGVLKGIIRVGWAADGQQQTAATRVPRGRPRGLPAMARALAPRVPAHHGGRLSGAVLRAGGDGPVRGVSDRVLRARTVGLRGRVGRVTIPRSVTHVRVVATRRVLAYVGNHKGINVDDRSSARSLHHAC